MTQNEIELLSRACLGDRHAYGRLINAYQGLVFAVALNMTGNWADSEDVVQETFLRAWLGLRKLADPLRFAAWLCTIARRTSLEILKRNNKITIVDIDSELARQLPSDAESPAEAYARRQLNEILWEEVAELPARSREAILLFYIEGYSIARAAEFLGTGEAAFKMRLQYGRERLRDTIAERLDEELRRRKPDGKRSELIVATLPALPGVSGGLIASIGGVVVHQGGLAAWVLAGAGKQGLAIMVALLLGALVVLPVMKTRLRTSASPLPSSVETPVNPRVKSAGNPRTDTWRSRGATPLAAQAITSPSGTMPAMSPPTPLNVTLAVSASQTQVVNVKVVDEAGRHVAGAVIELYGLAFQENQFRWNGIPWKGFVPSPTAVTTDLHGIAMIVCPKVIDQQNVSAILFNVDHPGFCPERVAPYPIDGSASAVVLHKGAVLKISGYSGSKDHRCLNIQPQIDLAGTWKSRASGEDRSDLKADNAGIAALHLMHQKSWQKLADGALVNSRVPIGNHTLRLVCFSPQGRIDFSDPVQFQAEAGKEYIFDLELKPGVRVEGELDPSVKRPIKNGTIVAWVFHNQKINPHLGRISWQTWRPIAADGSFVFESLPPGQLMFKAMCDGAISRSYLTFVRQKESPPQSPPDQRRIKLPSVPMEPAVACEMTVVDERNQPIPQTRVCCPTALWSNAPLITWAAWLSMPFGNQPMGMEDVILGRKMLNYEGPPFSIDVMTDSRGVAVFYSLMPRASSPNIDNHDNALMPSIMPSINAVRVMKRDAKVDLMPGQNPRVIMRMQKRANAGDSLNSPSHNPSVVAVTSP